MSSQSYKTASSRDISVSAQASYSGLVSVSGGFSLDKSEREAASKFMKEVETTTITVGAAPPSNGDAIFWASTVKENPVPTSYKIEPISKLFTKRFMEGYGINYTSLRKKLVGIENLYCQQLLHAGTVNTCEKSISVGITIPQYYLQSSIAKFHATETSCISRCFENRHCLSIAYITNSNECRFYDDEKEHGLSKEANAKTKIVVFPTKINDQKTDFIVQDLRVAILARPKSKTTVDVQSCKKACLNDSSCDVFNFCSDKNYCKSEINNCKLFSSKSVIKFEKADAKYKMLTYFISDY